MDTMREDMVSAALHTPGPLPDDPTIPPELARDRHTALACVNTIEGSIVEHDARTFPGYALIGSDVMGRAVFEKWHERFEALTAN